MCVIGDALFAIVDAIGDIGVGEAAADVAGAGLAGAGAAGAFGGADASTASLATDATAPALDSSTISGLASTTAGVGGSGASTAMLPEIDVTAASTAPGAGAAGGGGALGGALDVPGVAGAVGPVATAGLSALGGGAGGGGSGVAGATGASPEGIQSPAGLTANNATPAVSDLGTGLDSGGGYLPATGDSSVFQLSPDLAQSLGVDINANNFGAADAGVGGFPADDPTLSPSLGGNAANDLGANVEGPSFLDQTGTDLSKYFSSPKNDATAGLLGLSLKNALSKPKLPSSLSAAQGNAGAAAQGALSTIQSGGTATPEWASQKSSIDATINQQIQQQTQAIMQAAASNGEGTQNSGIVQQQIAQMTQNANVQRQQLYSQAQQQNVSAALSELSGGDQTLTAIGNTQLQQSEQAQALAAQTAEMALLLQTGQKIPGSGVVAGP